MSAIEQYKSTNRKRIEKIHVLYPFLFNSRSENHREAIELAAGEYNRGTCSIAGDAMRDFLCHLFSFVLSDINTCDGR